GGDVVGIKSAFRSLATQRFGAHMSGAPWRSRRRSGGWFCPALHATGSRTPELSHHLRVGALGLARRLVLEEARPAFARARARGVWAHPHRAARTLAPR